jgi:putative effector of murein hydrolase LrgA (UPF0299 family)
VQLLLHPLLLFWIPVTVGMVLRGDLTSNFEARVYEVRVLP